MTGTEIALIITACGTFLTAASGVIISLRNARKLEQVHQTTNSKMDELIKLTAKSSRAEGVKAGLGGEKEPPAIEESAR